MCEDILMYNKRLRLLYHEIDFKAREKLCVLHRAQPVEKVKFKV